MSDTTDVIEKVEMCKVEKRLIAALRHVPGRWGININYHGFTPVRELCASIPGLKPEILQRIIDNDGGNRLEVYCKGEFIRARYGHTLPWVEILHICSPPPSALYHGTAPRFLKGMMDKGFISPGKRNFVHLAMTIEQASRAGKRYCRAGQDPIVLEIDTKKMGHVFQKANETVWLTKYVPVAYTKVVRK